MDYISHIQNAYNAIAPNESVLLSGVVPDEASEEAQTE